MARELYPAIPPSTSQHVRQRPPMPRLLASILIGAGITVLLTCIAVLLFWLVASSQHAIARTVNSLIALLVTFLHIPLFLLVIAAELVVFSLLLWLATRSRALLTYLRAAREGEEPYHLRYAPLAYAVRPEQDVSPHLQNSSAAPETSQEQLPVLDLLAQDGHVLLLGDVGMGKTMALREYLYMNAQDRWTKVRGNGHIPIYVPLQLLCCLSQNAP